jgi:hypothetical protein
VPAKKEHATANANGLRIIVGGAFMDGISGTLRVVNQCNPTNHPESLLPIQAQKQKAGALSVGLFISSGNSREP